MSSLLQTGKSGTKIIFVNDPDHPDGLEEESRILGVGMWFSRCWWYWSWWWQSWVRRGRSRPTLGRVRPFRWETTVLGFTDSKQGHQHCLHQGCAEHIEHITKHGINDFDGWMLRSVELIHFRSLVRYKVYNREEWVFVRPFKGVSPNTVEVLL